jgi:NADH dehydrogenase FAD-containing subunit
VYVLGDNAATQYSGLAQTAVHDANYAARRLEAVITGASSPQHHNYRPITVVPVGKRWAVLEYGSFSIGGWPAAIIRRVADFIGYLDISPFFMALTLWFANRRIEDDCAICRKSD